MPPAYPGVRDRLHLLAANRDAIAIMLGRAADGGLDIPDAVVVVVDQRDPVGCDLAMAAADKAGLDAAEEGTRAAARGDIPTAIIVLELRAARAVFCESHPEVARGLAQHPHQGRIRTVVIAAGAAMLVHAQARAVRATG